MTDLFSCSISLVWFPDDGPLRTETCSNTQCDIEIQTSKHQVDAFFFLVYCSELIYLRYDNNEYLTCLPLSRVLTRSIFIGTENLSNKMIRNLRYLSLIGFALNDLRDNSTEVISSHLYTNSNYTCNSGHCIRKRYARTATVQSRFLTYLFLRLLVILLSHPLSTSRHWHIYLFIYLFVCVCVRVVQWSLKEHKAVYNIRTLSTWHRWKKNSLNLLWDK